MLTKEEKALRQRYIDLVTEEVWSGSERMKKHYEKKTDRVFKTEKGYLIEIEKPSIETKFCFGYSDSRYDMDDYNRANNMAHHARTNEDYFIEENLKQVQRIIDDLKNKRFSVFTRVRYCGSPDDSLIRSYKLYWDYQKDWGEITEEYEELSEADRKSLIAVYEETKKDFEKRIHAYLKRYGLSKVDSWSYWRDA